MGLIVGRAGVIVVVIVSTVASVLAVVTVLVIAVAAVVVAVVAAVAVITVIAVVFGLASLSPRVGQSDSDRAPQWHYLAVSGQSEASCGFGGFL